MAEAAAAAWEEVASNEYIALETERGSGACRVVVRAGAKPGAKAQVLADGTDADACRARFAGLTAQAERLAALGLTPAKAAETLRNAALTAAILEMADAAGAAASSADRGVGAVLYAAATKIPAAAARHRAGVARLVAERKVRQANLDAVCRFLARTGAGDLDEARFAEECGVGASVAREDVAAEVAGAVAQVRDALLAERYAYDVMGLFRTVRALPRLKWADNREVKEEFDAQILALLGPKTDADVAAAKAKSGGRTPSPAAAAASAAASAALPKQKQYDHGLRLPMPEENVQLRPDILAAHLQRTGGKLVTRFPPEPNGFLHIGHAKSMFLNFGLAKKHGGVCYLRLDDTNPERENQVYIQSIIDNVHWLGHTPYKITHASQYFDQLLECAIELIKRGKAYVCHQTSEEISASRELRQPSPWRDRSVEENLRLFELMRQGRFAEGEATLRMKMDIKSENPCLWDLIAYRIKYVPHPMTGNKYCIYPSYDFTHDLNDSFEDIDLSLCTLEFLPRRASYYWELDALERYRPVVWEFSRLNITRTVMSKRKLLKLVTSKLVRGWDDPRLPTINGLRRRGYSPAAINTFCDAVGVTTNTIVWTDYTFLEHHCRMDMEARCNRAMGVLDPLLVEIANFAPDQTVDVERPNHPADPSRGKNHVTLTKFLYIDRADFKLEDKKDFWGLAPGKAVGLRYAGVVTCTEVVKGADGRVEKIVVTYDFDKKIKPQGFIHWVAKPSATGEPLLAEVRLYEPLFMSDKPDELKNWESDINPNSETVITAFLDETLRTTKPGDAFQWERVGFFCCDPDSTPEKPVWVRTVSLKESKEKKHL